MVGSTRINQPFLFVLKISRGQKAEITSLKQKPDIEIKFFIALYYSRAILYQTSLNFHVTYTVGLFKFLSIVLMNNSSKPPY